MRAEIRSRHYTFKLKSERSPDEAKKNPGPVMNRISQVKKAS